MANSIQKLVISTWTFVDVLKHFKICGCVKDRMVNKTITTCCCSAGPADATAWVMLLPSCCCDTMALGKPWGSMQGKPRVWHSACTWCCDWHLRGSSKRLKTLLAEEHGMPHMIGNKKNDESYDDFNGHTACCCRYAPGPPILWPGYLDLCMLCGIITGETVPIPGRKCCGKPKTAPWGGIWPDAGWPK